jgi:1-deoxy-D-xylulose-5-phosphate reductoisomerase
MTQKRLVVLGSTGSIGTQALEVARWRGYRVVGLAAGKNAARLLEQAHAFRPRLVSCDESVADEVRRELPRESSLVTGPDAAQEIARLDADSVVAAIPGFSGLAPTLAALERGRHVALANKEAMVVAGPLVWQAARAHGASITPLDSEHSALFQCLVGEARESVASLVLTASGGPFLREPDDLSTVTPEAALKHPTWTMGKKVTIDSATLFNKGLEVLEAHFYFEFPLDKIEVVIHPQSLIHSFVRFRDGNLKAQIGPHDMRVPIHYGLEHPARPEVPLKPLPLTGCWELLEVDKTRFPSLALAYEAGSMGGTAPAALNAADEVAVDAFLQRKIRFSDIPRVIGHVLNKTRHHTLGWDTIAEADREAREHAHAWLERRPTTGITRQ